MSDSIMLRLLQDRDWGEYGYLMDGLRLSPYFAPLTDALERLDRSVLFRSKIHGVGHIERTMCHGAFCARAERLDAVETQLLLEACSYHDVGRRSDWVDYTHGYRASVRLAELTGREGLELRLEQAAVEAHSRRDVHLADVLAQYEFPDVSRARRLAELLKDADGLDRVRLGDLNPDYLRRQASRDRVGFAQRLFDRYRALETGGGCEPFV